MSKDRIDEMIEDSKKPQTLEKVNESFQYLWRKFERDDWKSENLVKYCEMLENLVMNYLESHHALDSSTESGHRKSEHKLAKKKKRVDLDTRPYPNPLFKNYDYVDEPKSEKENAKDNFPGGGLYHGKMDKYKSVKEFIDIDRKLRQKQRKIALRKLIGF